MTEIPVNVPLSGGDYFNLALYYTGWGSAKQDSTCEINLVLSDSFSFDVLVEVLDKSVFFNCLGAVNLRRFFPFKKPIWQWRSIGPLAELRCGNVLNTHSGLCFELVAANPGRNKLRFSWPHEIMDARGAEIFLQNLQHVYVTGTDRPGLVGAPQEEKQRKFQALYDLPKHINQARRAVHYITEASRIPMACLSKSGKSPALGSSKRHVINFNEQETALIDEQCRQHGTGLMKSLYYLSVSIQGVDAVLSERNIACRRYAAGRSDNLLTHKGDYVVPVPMDLRLRGAPGPALSNHISTLTYRVKSKDVKLKKEIVKSLKVQLLAQIEAGIPADCRRMMDLFRNFPLSVYSRAILGPTKGQVASFFFSDLGESLRDMDEFLGANIQEVTHFAPARNPPGITLVFLRYKGCQKIALSYAETTLTKAELQLMVNGLKAGMLGNEQVR